MAMSYELKRDEGRWLEVKAGDKVFRVSLRQGLRKYQDYLRFKSQLEAISVKIKNGMELTADALELFMELVKSLLACIFKKEDIPEILAFFDDDCEECLQAVTPFIMGEYQKALKEELQKRSEEKLHEYLSR